MCPARERWCPKWEDNQELRHQATIGNASCRPHAHSDAGDKPEERNEDEVNDLENE